ncbi:MAG TPA: hypothetical protein VHE79_01185 [Spirochaetia bacterium]
MEKMGYASLVSRIEQLIASHVFGSYPAGWDETLVTRSLVKAIRGRLGDLLVTGFKRNFRIWWDAYVYGGADTVVFSNLALLVKIQHKDGSRVEGSALIEARKRTDKKQGFDGLRWNQVSRLCSNAPHSQLLLYDYEDIRSFSSNIAIRVQSMRPSYWREQVLVSPFTYAVLAPTNLALAVKANDASLYTFSSPLAQQLVFRYLHGLDLDFTPKALTLARGYPGRLGHPETLLCLRVVEEGTQDVETLELNREAWKELE